MLSYSCTSTLICYNTTDVLTLCVCTNHDTSMNTDTNTSLGTSRWALDADMWAPPSQKAMDLKAFIEAQGFFNGFSRVLNNGCFYFSEVKVFSRNHHDW